MGSQKPTSEKVSVAEKRAEGQILQNKTGNPANVQNGYRGKNEAEAPRFFSVRRQSAALTAVEPSAKVRSAAPRHTLMAVKQNPFPLVMNGSSEGEEVQEREATEGGGERGGGEFGRGTAAAGSSGTDLRKSSPHHSTICVCVRPCVCI